MAAFGLSSLVGLATWGALAAAISYGMDYLDGDDWRSVPLGVMLLAFLAMVVVAPAAGLWAGTRFHPVADNLVDGSSVLGMAGSVVAVAVGIGAIVLLVATALFFMAAMAIFWVMAAFLGFVMVVGVASS